MVQTFPGNYIEAAPVFTSDPSSLTANSSPEDWSTWFSQYQADQQAKAASQAQQQALIDQYIANQASQGNEFVSLNPYQNSGLDAVNYGIYQGLNPVTADNVASNVGQVFRFDTGKDDAGMLGGSSALYAPDASGNMVQRNAAPVVFQPGQTYTLKDYSGNNVLGTATTPEEMQALVDLSGGKSAFSLYGPTPGVTSSDGTSPDSRLFASQAPDQTWAIMGPASMAAMAAMAAAPAITGAGYGIPGAAVAPGAGAAGTGTTAVGASGTASEMSPAIASAMAQDAAYSAGLANTAAGVSSGLASGSLSAGLSAGELASLGQSFGGLSAAPAATGEAALGPGGELVVSHAPYAALTDAQLAAMGTLAAPGMATIAAGGTPAQPQSVTDAINQQNLDPNTGASTSSGLTSADVAAGTGAVGGGTLSLNNIIDYLRLAGLASGVIGSAASGAGTNSTISGKMGALNPTFSASLPAANIPGLAPGTTGARTTGLPQTNQDWYRYGYGPQQSFFNYVPQGAPNTSTAFTGYAEGGDVHAGAYASGGSSFAVEGAGDGRDDKIPAMLSDGEYVMDAETVALLGNGSNKAGAKALDNFRVNLRKQKGRQMAKGKFSVKAKKPEQYLAGGRI